VSAPTETPRAHSQASRLNPRRFRHGIALLPALITTGNIFCGFIAIIRAIHHDYWWAACFIMGAIVLDMADGRIARMTGTASEFGGELDSLADAISFGVAPALLAYLWGMSRLPRIGWLIAFLFVVCGVMRLARFNVQRNVVDKRFFVGLPIPAAAGQVAMVILFAPAPLEERTPAALLATMTGTLALLMVSTFRYASGKSIDLKSRRSYMNVLLIAVVFLLVALHPVWVLLALSSLYALSAPILYAFGLLRRKGTPPTPAQPVEPVSV
jgi:CDP-diacylglycerol--serine O-phosphatidyltransferase